MINKEDSSSFRDINEPGLHWYICFNLSSDFKINETNRTRKKTFMICKQMRYDVHNICIQDMHILNMNTWKLLFA
jgi:hypothetical protein